MLSKDPKKRATQLSNLRPRKKGSPKVPGSGKKKSIITSTIEEMEGLGFSMPSKEEMRKCLLICACLDESQIKSLITDKTKPMMLRVIAKQVLSDDGFYAIEHILDRTVGKMLDITSNDKAITKPEPIVVEIIDKAEQVDRGTDVESTDNENI